MKSNPVKKIKTKVLANGMKTNTSLKMALLPRKNCITQTGGL